MRSIVFAKRNLKEILRDPLSLIFNIGFPVLMFFIFKLIMSGIAEEALVNVPQFKPERLAVSIAVFGFSFITLFGGMLVAKDRTTSFLARLKTSPLTATEFLIGYILPLIPIVLIQMALSYGLSIIFGLPVTGGLLLSMVSILPMALFFIALGILLGMLFNDKAIGGISSIVINLAAILGGMFMPIDTMGSTIKTIAYIFPFANSLKVANCIITGNTADILTPLLVVCAYTIVVVVVSVFVFQKKINSDNL